MQTTPASLLMRLRQPGQQLAWSRFVELYAPLLYHWARRLGLRPDDAADLVQDVFVILVRRLPEFVYEPGKRFRGWLWTIVRNAWRARRRQAAAAPTAAAGVNPDELPDLDDSAAIEESVYRQQLVGRALLLVRGDFQPITWKAFQEFAVAGRSASAVAAELGISINAVYLARSRVLRRLRAELLGLLD